MATKPTTAELNTLLLTLTAKVNELVGANVALATRLDEAHARIDHAGAVFKDLRRALKPTPEPAARLPRAEFDRALADLRADAGQPHALFTRTQIIERARALRTMEANRQMAAA